MAKRGHTNSAMAKALKRALKGLANEPTNIDGDSGNDVLVSDKVNVNQQFILDRVKPKSLSNTIVKRNSKSSVRKKNKEKKKKKIIKKFSTSYGPPDAELAKLYVTHESVESKRKRASSVNTQDAQHAPVAELKLDGDFYDIAVSKQFRTEANRSKAILLDDPRVWPAVAVEERLLNPHVLRLGLDMGTSATKVVIQDPARGQTAWAVPFFKGTENDYLLPTTLRWIDDQPFVGAQSEALKPFKWKLINDDLDSATLVDAIAYLGIVLRHVASWLQADRGNYYQASRLIWELRVGLPAESTENEKLCRTYQVLLSKALELACSNNEITQENVKKLAAEAKKFIFSKNKIAVDQHFAASGFLLPQSATPELVANIEGFYRSRKWDRERPYGLLVDVGASTIDCAFCSFTGGDHGDQLSVFTRSVESLGVFRLHDSRVEWLIDQLEFLKLDSDRIDSLFNELISIDFDRPIPESITEYLSGVRVAGPSPDKAFTNKVGQVITINNLIKGFKSFFGGTPHNKSIPVYISGGGSRHPLYQSLFQRISQNRNRSWTLEIKQLGVPDFVAAAGLDAEHRDRLAVAYGLCGDLFWYIEQPDQIEDFVISISKKGVRYISKDQV